MMGQKEKLTEALLIDIVLRDKEDLYCNEKEVFILSDSPCMVYASYVYPARGEYSSVYLNTEEMSLADLIALFGLVYVEDLEELDEEDLMELYHAGKAHIYCKVGAEGESIRRKFVIAAGRSVVFNLDQPAYEPEVFDVLIEDPLRAEAYVLGLAEEDM